jgi:hypothetical protein
VAGSPLQCWEDDGCGRESEEGASEQGGPYCTA